ncbi:TadE family protein [Nocardioides seonyuensis]|uniref:TadE family protein n=1 Tax=Nocardioides seonyuensis TaxID=2518371 RepID=UPI001FC987CE|nr:TadE family protein [Nocardioides seonyuensis]
MSIELVILLPALMAVLFLGMQAALYHHAQTVAIAAAQEGARVVAAENGHEGLGISAAQDFVAVAGGDEVLTSPTVTADRTPTRATVIVRGYALSVIPGWRPEIRQAASMPVERLS